MACNIDHSLEDVSKKLESQKEFLPSHIYDAVNVLLSKKPDQQVLNEVFHALKKYDLANDEEKHERNEILNKLT
ncbi:group-specific protein [Evansella halocellulosilytica]|uniref:group-specific protein n=1 Tax=Evansella halocellulosilytica TaxID=2011013 RepID=UPI000BB8E3C4|nr:group-specific protein [Evansella halocellulosilytica]